ncbi:hypothetical protein HNR48_001937 [Pseudoteredinibacter isoporae]|uniref:Uncharacterized protein n=1 Tax=Pseudoteredinibacter isoporae TaxID=570281 RepID=A0A7X0JSW6_9GAMM|nr:hypothetical protein [Pseudoteredinibacter isoporae]
MRRQEQLEGAFAGANDQSLAGARVALFNPPPL